MKLSYRWSLAAVLLCALVLAPLASGRDHASGAPAYNATDTAFTSLMTPHHTGGVELGRLAVRKGVDPQVRRLGRDIVVAQSRELRTLRRMLRVFGAEPLMPEAIEERDMMGMRMLRAASGAEFDRLWLDVISGHHSAAIQMALIEVRGGRYPQATRLAREIVRTQSRELRRFTALLRQTEG